jgi:predicted SAM-dependent methyltransferase
MSLLHGEAVKLRVFVRPAAIKKYLNTHQFRMLNLGAGPNRKSGWLTADAFKPQADIYMNVCRRFPFSDNVFDVVYSEHMLEHIHVDRVRRLLEEIYRVLKPGATFRVTVPDLEIHANNYVAKNSAFFAEIIEKYKGRWATNKDKYWLIRSNGGAFMSRAVQRFYRHRWMYDFETLSSCLTEVGFSHCEKKSFGISNVQAAGAMDRADRAFETLYIDATK